MSADMAAVPYNTSSGALKCSTLTRGKNNMKENEKEW
jgi:hypothetical protein